MKPLTRWAASSSTLPTGDSPCMPVKYRWMGDATPLKLEWRPQRGQIPVGSDVSGGVSELGSGPGSSWLRGKKGICWALCEHSVSNPIPTYEQGRPLSALFVLVEVVAGVGFEPTTFGL